MTKQVLQTFCLLVVLTYTIMVILSRGGGGYRGVELVQFIWNICASITNNRLNSVITLRNELHSFR